MCVSPKCGVGRGRRNKTHKSYPRFSGSAWKIKAERASPRHNQVEGKIEWASNSHDEFRHAGRLWILQRLAPTRATPIHRVGKHWRVDTLLTCVYISGGALMHMSTILCLVHTAFTDHQWGLSNQRSNRISQQLHLTSSCSPHRPGTVRSGGQWAHWGVENFLLHISAAFFCCMYIHGRCSFCVIPFTPYISEAEAQSYDGSVRCSR